MDFAEQISTKFKVCTFQPWGEIQDASLTGFLETRPEGYWVHTHLVGSYDFAMSLDDIYVGGCVIPFLLFDIWMGNPKFIGRIVGRSIYVTKFISPEEQIKLQTVLDDYEKRTGIRIEIEKGMTLED